jgi:ATP-dependent protease ClpP protease subunit
LNVYPIKCRIYAEAAATRVDVYDDIGEGGWFSDGLTAKDFAAQMSAVKGPLDVHINSYGGDVSEGIAIASTIRDHKGPKKTVVDGFAASIASIIAQAGDERVMQPGSMMMIHDALSGCSGNAAAMREAAAFLDKHSDNLAAIYASRAGGTAKQWRDTMLKDTWYTAEEAVAAGLADKIGTGTAVLPAEIDVAAFTAVPGRIAARLREMPVAARPQDAARHDPMTGTHSHPHPAYGSQGGDSMHSHEHTHDGDANHSHSHAEPEPDDAGDGAQGHAGDAAGLTAGQVRAVIREELANASGVPGSHGDHERFDPDGDGDCDACPEGDTDHDYWSADGKQLQSVPGKPMPASDALTADVLRAILAGELPGLVRAELHAVLAAAAVDNSPWDAQKAWSAGAGSDDPAAFYEGICAGKKAGDKSTQAAWALPYKYAPSSPPNAAGVRNALARLPQTQGLTNEAEAKATLQAAMKKVNPDWEPEDHTEPDLSGIDLDELRAVLKGAVA